MTPYEMAAGSLFMAKEAGLQEILKSLGEATGSDPTKLQDSLVGLLGGGGLGAAVGGLTGGGKGALLGGSLGGVGGAAAGYAGSDYVRAMLEKLLNKGNPELGPIHTSDYQLPKEDKAGTIDMGPLLNNEYAQPKDFKPENVDLGPLTMADHSRPGALDLGDPAPQFLNMNGSNMGNGFNSDLNIHAPSVDMKGQHRGNITTGPNSFTNVPPDPFKDLQALQELASAGR